MLRGSRKTGDPDERHDYVGTIMPDSSSFQLVMPANAFLDKHLRTADNSVLLPALPQDLCCTNPNGGVETALSAIIRKTQTQTAVDSLPYQHYRLVLWSIGRPLTTFRCTKELVTGVLDTMKGSSTHAF